MKDRPEHTALARRLRREQTEAEKALWERLRHRQLGGVKFRRQQPMGPFTVDLVCFERKLIIEIDGGQHNETEVAGRDEERTAWLTERGYQVLRFWNSEVLANTEGVLERVSEALGVHPHPRPLPSREREVPHPLPLRERGNPPSPPREGVRGRGTRGATLLETVVALALIAVVLPALLTGLASASTVTDNTYDRSVLFELAQSQMEEVQRQAYQENASNYTLIPAPAGYSLAISATPAASYTYPAPKSTATAETVQLVTVTVTGVRGSLSLQGYKVRR